MRISWPAAMASSVSKVEGAQVVQASAGTYTFSLADEAVTRLADSSPYNLTLTLTLALALTLALTLTTSPSPSPITLTLTDHLSPLTSHPHPCPHPHPHPHPQVAISVGSHQKAFEVHLTGVTHLEPPLTVSCVYQLKQCTGAKWQLVEDWGSGYRAEVLVASWAPGAQVRTHETHTIYHQTHDITWHHMASHMASRMASHGITPHLIGITTQDLKSESASSQHANITSACTHHPPPILQSPACGTATPPHRHTATPPHRHTATRPHGHTATPPHRHTATPPHRHTATRPHGHAATRPHGHTATRPHWPLTEPSAWGCVRLMGYVRR